MADSDGDETISVGNEPSAEPLAGPTTDQVLPLEPPEGYSAEDYCKSVELDTPAAARLRDRASIHNDLVFVLRCCEFLLELQGDEVRPKPEHPPFLPEALWTAILIAYERCFSGGMRSSLQHLDLLEIDPSGGALKLHKHYEAMRDKHLAHSVNPFSTTKAVAQLSSHSSGRRQVERIAAMSLRHVFATADEVRQLAYLVEQLRLRVANDCNALVDDLVLQEARKLDIDWLYEQADASIVTPGPEDARRPRR